MAPGDRRNYLARCRRTGRWLEWARASLQPLRYLAYRWRQDLLSPPAPARHTLRHDLPPGLTFTGHIPDLFAAGVEVPCGHPERAALFSEVEGQMRGVFRLAGGAHFTLDGPPADLPDIEHLHAYHRLYWAVRYARAAFCGLAGALEELERGLSGWLSQDWEGDPAAAAPYTASERIASLAEVLFWLGQAAPPGLGDLVPAVKRRICLDALHLREHLEIREDFNNHILNNARALYIASRMVPEAPQAGEWEALAFELWEAYFPPLLLEDGSFGEQTSFYHLQMCRTALEYLLAARRTGRGIEAGLSARLWKMFELADHLLRPDGSLIRSGNSSPDHTAQDFWGLLAAAHAHGFLPRPPRHGIVTLLTLYYGGRAVTSPALPKQDAGRQAALFPAGGWAFLTDPRLGVDLAAHGDPRPMTYCSGDAGRGTFELWWRNTVLIREPGNPAYTLGSRHWYRGGGGQNVSTLDGVPPGLSAEYQAQLPAWYFESQDGEWQDLGGDGLRYVSHGLRRLDASIVLTRTWSWRGGAELAMTENIAGQGRYRFASSLHLGDAPWEQCGPSSFLCAQGGSQAVMRLDLPAQVRLEVVPSRFAPEYGVEQAGRTLRLSGRAALPLAWSVAWEFRP